MSRAEKLLVAAGSLAARGKSSFSAEDLAVEAWRIFKTDFSLKGHSDHPDSNMVLTQVMGKKAPLIIRGWLEKIGAKQYRITAKGISDLQNLGYEGGEIVSRIRVDRELEHDLGPLLTSDAFEMWKQGQGEAITFHQFCRFANLSARDDWQKVAGKLEQVSYLVDQAAKWGGSGETVRLHVRNRNPEFTPEDLLGLVELHKFLTKRFKSEMDAWKRHATA